MNIELFFCCVVGAEGDDQYVRPAGQHLSHRQRGQLGRGEDEGLQEEEAGRRPGPGRTTKVIFLFFFLLGRPSGNTTRTRSSKKITVIHG